MTGFEQPVKRRHPRAILARDRVLAFGQGNAVEFPTYGLLDQVGRIDERAIGKDPCVEVKVKDLHKKFLSLWRGTIHRTPMAFDIGRMVNKSEGDVKKQGAFPPVQEKGVFKRGYFVNNREP